MQTSWRLMDISIYLDPQDSISSKKTNKEDLPKDFQKRLKLIEKAFR